MSCTIVSDNILMKNTGAACRVQNAGAAFGCSILEQKTGAACGLRHRRHV